MADSFVDFSVRFLVPFLRSIFDPFLDFSLRAICLFYGTFWISRCLFGPFLDGFLTVHFIMIFTFRGRACFLCLSSPWAWDWCSSSTNNKALLGSSPLAWVACLLLVWARPIYQGYELLFVTRAADAVNFIAVLGYPLGDDPCPISKRVDLRRNWGSGRLLFTAHES